jgi:DNA mismatch repair protein MSH4
MIVSGPNMSGKSTYLRQVALMTILAHIGCYVPANFASFPIIDHIFTRLGTGDNLELNSSTFMTEMRETAYFMHNLGRRSLVVIDELGRATSTSDGLAISWSCCEFMLSSKAYVIFATHMQQLSDLSRIYPDAQSYSFAVGTNGRHMNFKHTLTGGSSNVAHYGLLMSEVAGLPAEVVSNARKVTERLLQQKRSSLHITDKEKYRQLHENYYIARRIVCLQYSQQPRERLLQGLKSLKERLSKSIV